MDLNICRSKSCRKEERSYSYSYGSYAYLGVRYESGALKFHLKFAPSVLKGVEKDIDFSALHQS
jgi:hypothetical protein